MEKRLNVLMSAYACEPDRGSEPEVGWRWALEMAKHHDITVITRANNQAVIEAGLANVPPPHPRFVYHDLSARTVRWKRMPLGVQMYYGLWQRGVLRLGRHLHRLHQFDLCHHVTFGKCTVPSPLAALPIPLIFGPVGGGEKTPPGFRSTYGFNGQLLELARDTARATALLNPASRSLLRRTHTILAATPQTAAWLGLLHRSQIPVEAQCGMTEADLNGFGAFPVRQEPAVRFISIARLVHWKGIHLALRAFARFAAKQPESEYWVVSSGPEEHRLRSLAVDLGVASKVTFWGRLPRLADVHGKLAAADVLVHPALHEAFGYACLEALAAGRPVICLDWGGPSMQVTRECGFALPVCSPEQTVEEMADAMAQLATRPQLRHGMAAAGRRRARDHFLWSQKATRMASLYIQVVSGADWGKS